MPQHSSRTPACFAGRSDEQAEPDICRLAPHLQQEWDHEANAHLGSIIVLPLSHRKVWWSSGKCKTGQPHKWQARISDRTKGTGSPYKTGKAVCPCNDLAHNYPEVAREWDCEANGERTPETVSAMSNSKAAWRCRLCGHKWGTRVAHRTALGSGCPQCAHEARRIKPRQPSISGGASHLLAEWDWDPNEKCGWHPDHLTLASDKKVHWVQRDECKLGLVHRWQAKVEHRARLNHGSPFPPGQAVCACNSLAVQCQEAADLWDYYTNGDLTPGDIAVQSNKVVAWMGPDGKQWHQRVDAVVNNVRRRHMS